MHESFIAEFETKMRTSQISEAAIKAFHRNYTALINQETGMIPEESILPVTNIAHWSTEESSIISDSHLLNQTVVIKLNGGLGTSMGLQKAKSLLTVKGQDTFLDLIVKQIKSLRHTTGSNIRLLLMNSFSTSADTLKALAPYKSDNLAKAEDVELLQNRIPKIDAKTFKPATYTKNTDLEWCPPGHGDLYPALSGSGWLEKLLAQGIKYAFISNSDNLGAVLDPKLLTWFAQSQAPFAMEVTKRTEADKKGGHLALRKADNHLILREVAQCPDENMAQFQDINTHQYFNTNNLWIRLDILAEVLKANDGVLPLPMIKNSKTVDPRDAQSTKVFQLETAMGAGIECFEGATAIDVPRSRFAPVKTTGDLFALRSDAYIVTDDGQVRLAPERQGKPPVISLDSKLHKLVDSLEKLGEPSLIHVNHLSLKGDVRFVNGTPLSGDCSWENTNETPLIVGE